MRWYKLEIRRTAVDRWQVLSELSAANPAALRLTANISVFSADQYAPVIIRLDNVLPQYQTRYRNISGWQIRLSAGLYGGVIGQTASMGYIVVGTVYDMLQDPVASDGTANVMAIRIYPPLFLQAAGAAVVSGMIGRNSSVGDSVAGILRRAGYTVQVSSGAVAIRAGESQHWQDWTVQEIMRFLRANYGIVTAYRAGVLCLMTTSDVAGSAPRQIRYEDVIGQPVGRSVVPGAGEREIVTQMTVRLHMRPDLAYGDRITLANRRMDVSQGFADVMAGWTTGQITYSGSWVITSLVYQLDSRGLGESAWSVGVQCVAAPESLLGIS